MIKIDCVSPEFGPIVGAIRYISVRVTRTHSMAESENSNARLLCRPTVKKLYDEMDFERATLAYLRSFRSPSCGIN
jgi:hypothetical protein